MYFYGSTIIMPLHPGVASDHCLQMFFIYFYFLFFYLFIFYFIENHCSIACRLI